MNETLSANLASQHNVDEAVPPFVTVAIPHYKNRRFLEKVLESLFEQTYQDFEILVSDNKSPDDSSDVIPGLLQQSGRTFSYYVQQENVGYDKNVRFCLVAARGRYVFLLGNDDTISTTTTLQDVADKLRELDFPEVAFTNYEEWSVPGSVVQRALTTSVIGSGPPVALQSFRTFSFLSGLIYDRVEACRYDTDRWDESIYYQIYIACRILASGGRLAALNINAIRKDVRIEGQTVTNYVIKWTNAKWSFGWRHTGLDSVMRVTADAIVPLLPKNKRSAALRQIIGQTLLTSYIFWLFEYRRIANWAVAFGVARDLWPGARLAEYKLSYRHRTQLWLLYWLVTFVGLFAPVALIGRIKVQAAQLMRKRQQAKR